MKNKLIVLFLILFTICISSAYTEGNVSWKQRGFVLSAFNALNADTTQYKKVLTLTKNSGIDLVELTFLSRENLNSALKIAEEVGVKVLAQDLTSFCGRGSEIPAFTEGSVAKEVNFLRKYKMLEGYYVWDEPHEKDFEAVRRLQDLFKKYDSGHLAFSVIYPSYGIYIWKDGSYPKYVDNYLKTVDPEVMSFDYYPFRTYSDSLGNNDIWKDFGYIRKKALEYNKPLWFYFQAVGFEPVHVKLNLERIRAQMYAALAYGVKGLSYYYENKNGVLLDSLFNPSKMYPDLKQLNAEVKNLGNFLYSLKSEKIYHTSGNIDELAGSFFLDKLEESDLIKSAPKNLVIGVFGDSSAKKYVLVSNLSHTNGVKGKIELAKPMKINGYNKKTGTEKRISKSSGTLEINLPAGEAVLYILQ